VPPTGFWAYFPLRSARVSAEQSRKITLSFLEKNRRTENSKNVWQFFCEAQPPLAAAGGGQLFLIK